MKTKLDIIRRFLGTAEVVEDESNNYLTILVGDDGVNFQKDVGLTTQILVIIPNSELEAATFDEGDMVIGEQRFSLKKIISLTPPAELLSKDQLDDLFNEIADDVGFDAKVHYGYSGRGMYGSQCYGISGDGDAIIRAANARGLNDYRQDNLGHDSIIYWPRIKYIPDAEVAAKA